MVEEGRKRREERKERERERERRNCQHRQVSDRRAAGCLFLGTYGGFLFSIAEKGSFFLVIGYWLVSGRVCVCFLFFCSGVYLSAVW